MKAIFWAGCVGDSVDTAVGTLFRKLPMKSIRRQQSVRGGSNHFHGATFLGVRLSLGKPWCLGQDEKGGDKPCQIDHKHCLVAATLSLMGNLIPVKKWSILRKEGRIKLFADDVGTTSSTLLSAPGLAFVLPQGILTMKSITDIFYVVWTLREQCAAG